MKSDEQNSTYGALVERQVSWILFFAGWGLSPKEDRTPGFCPWLHRCLDIQPSSFCALVLLGVEEMQKSFPFQRCEDLLKIWFTSSVKECGEPFRLGKDAPRVDRLFQCL